MDFAILYLSVLCTHPRIDISLFQQGPSLRYTALVVEKRKKNSTAWC